MTARQRRCVLDGRQRTRAAVLARLAHELGHPSRILNLDALYDVLRTDIPGPIAIHWRAGPAVRAALGPEFARLRRVLEEVARERADLHLTIEE